MYFATGQYELVAGRFIAGIGCGIGTVAVPMYLGEIAPPNLRGTLGSCNQLGCVIGILISQIGGLVLKEDPTFWRYLLLFSAIPSVIQILLSFCFLYLLSELVFFKTQDGLFFDSSLEVLLCFRLSISTCLNDCQ